MQVKLRLIDATLDTRETVLRTMPQEHTLQTMKNLFTTEELGSEVVLGNFKKISCKTDMMKISGLVSTELATTNRLQFLQVKLLL